MGLVSNLSVKTDEIIDYLHTHPDFFVTHPELLAGLTIPHNNIGQATSLIEYQVERLQQQIVRMQESLATKDAILSEQVRFIGAVHKFVLRVQTTKDNNTLYTTLYKGLRRLYQADRVLLLVFDNCENDPVQQDFRFLKTNSRLALMFTELVYRNKPLCGSLQEEHLLSLFDKDTPEIKSTVLLPVRQPQWNGLLVLGSRQQDCYCHGLELDTLMFIAAFAAHRIRI